MNMRDTLCRIEQALSVPAAEYVPAIRDAFDIISAARNELDREAPASRPQTSAPGGEGTSHGGCTRLVDALTKRYGHHFTTTLGGIVTAERVDFSRHPLVGKAVEALRAPTERTPLTDEQCAKAFDALNATRYVEWDDFRAGWTAAASSTSKDAARYRWLRDVGDATWRPFGVREGYSAAQADAAIDAAIERASRSEGV